MGNDDQRTGVQGFTLLNLTRPHPQPHEEDKDISRLEQRLSKLLTEAAFEEFPALKYMRADQIRDFGNLVTRTSRNLSVHIAGLSSSTEQPKEGA